MERVVITGIGLVSPLAIGKDETWSALLAGQSGVGPITLFDTTAFRVRIAGEVKQWDPLRWIEKKKLKEMDRFCEFSLGAAAMAIQDAQLELSPNVPAFSDIDGHQVNSIDRRQPLGAFKLFNFSAKIDPVPTMLVQSHRDVIPDFYGLTTSFTKRTLKPSVTILADETGAGWAKYIHGELGQGTWTFYGGHDPEDPQHQIGDPPTDLSLHPHSPGYRLILNNVLFPAAKKRELKT
jgi:hypothetical protein